MSINCVIQTVVYLKPSVTSHIPKVRDLLWFEKDSKALKRAELIHNISKFHRFDWFFQSILLGSYVVYISIIKFNVPMGILKNQWIKCIFGTVLW